MKLSDEMYISIIKQFMLPLFPLHTEEDVSTINVDDASDKVRQKDSYIEWETIHKEGNSSICLNFYSKILGEKKSYKVVFQKGSFERKEQNIPFLNSVWTEIITSISRINIPDKRKNDEQTKCYIKAICQTAVTIALAKNTIGSGRKAICTMLKIIQELESWSVRTYEGLKIPFGFIIDNSKEEIVGEDYTSFLESKHSALFTDGVFSAIELDMAGKIIQYIPLNNSIAPKNREKIPLCPTRFKRFAELCTGSKCGIMGLSNGDILIIKKQALMFAKRGGVWGKWGYSYFRSACSNIIELQNTTQIRQKNRLLKCIYNSLMDSSFAHSGACFAITQNVEGAKKILNNSSSQGENNQKKAIIRRLISVSGELLSFDKINEKLRTELMGLDGAFVIDTNGGIIAIGEILGVPPGSDEGGRTAAARALSDYGIGIKVSEDGDVTVYEKRQKILRFT